MRVKTPKTVMLKTVLVSGVKLPTTADRSGRGLPPVAVYPADSLSRGRFPTPRNPEPENVGGRQEVSAMQMRQQMHASTTAAAPAGRAGCPAPGSSARWCPRSAAPIRWRRVVPSRRLLGEG